MGPVRRAILLFLAACLSLAAQTEKAGKVKLPSGRDDLARGEKLFQGACALCHGMGGEGGRGPLLTRQKLSRAPDDAALVKVIEKGINGTEMPGASHMSPREMRQTAAFVRTLGRIQARPVPGDAARGGEIYRGKGNCASCHAIKGAGGISGPELAGIGLRRSAAYLREALLKPEAAVPEDYLLVKVAAGSGGAVTGVRINEDSFSIQIRDDAGRSHSFWKHEPKAIEKLRGKSPMPSYEGQLSDAEVTDLVAYLASLKEPL